MEKMENKEKKRCIFVSKEATNIFKLFTAIFYDYLSGNVFSSFCILRYSFECVFNSVFKRDVCREEKSWKMISINFDGSL